MEGAELGGAASRLWFGRSESEQDICAPLKSIVSTTKGGAAQCENLIVDLSDNALSKSNGPGKGCRL